MHILFEKRAQLHMVEAILSIVILSLILIVFYLSASSITVRNVDLSQDRAYEYLAASDDAGFLRPAVYYQSSNALNALEDFLYTIIPSDVLFRITVDSSTLPIGSYRSSSQAQVTVSYWLSGYDSETHYNRDYEVGLELWRQQEG